MALAQLKLNSVVFSLGKIRNFSLFFSLFSFTYLCCTAATDMSYHAQANCIHRLQFRFCWLFVFMLLSCVFLSWSLSHCARLCYSFRSDLYTCAISQNFSHRLNIAERSHESCAFFLSQPPFASSHFLMNMCHSLHLKAKIPVARTMKMHSMARFRSIFHASRA